MPYISDKLYLVHTNRGTYYTIATSYDDAVTKTLEFISLTHKTLNCATKVELLATSIHDVRFTAGCDLITNNTLKLIRNEPISD